MSSPLPHPAGAVNHVLRTAPLALAPRLSAVISGRVGDDILVTGRLRPLVGTV